MAKKGTDDINEYINDYERTMQDYSEMGPLWAEMVFGDDFEAMQAMYGRDGKPDQNRYNQSNHDQDNRGGKRR